MLSYSNQYHEMLWAYVNCVIDYCQLKEQLSLLNEAEEIKKGVA